MSHISRLTAFSKYADPFVNAEAIRALHRIARGGASRDAEGAILVDDVFQVYTQAYEFSSFDLERIIESCVKNRRHGKRVLSYLWLYLLVSRVGPTLGDRYLNRACDILVAALALAHVCKASGIDGVSEVVSSTKNFQVPITGTRLEVWSNTVFRELEMYDAQHRVSPEDSEWNYEDVAENPTFVRETLFRRALSVLLVIYGDAEVIRTRLYEP